MDEDEVTAIVHSLAHYLRAHPLASDSAQGIAQWWLPSEHSTETLGAALAWLERHGALEQDTGSDGRVRYRRRGGDAMLDAAVAARAHMARRGTR